MGSRPCGLELWIVQCLQSGDHGCKLIAGLPALGFQLERISLLPPPQCMTDTLSSRSKEKQKQHFGTRKITTTSVSPSFCNAPPAPSTDKVQHDLCKGDGLKEPSSSPQIRHPKTNLHLRGNIMITG